MLQRVEGLENGLYHYDVMDHALERIEGEFERAELAEAFPGPFFLETPMPSSS